MWCDEPLDRRVDDPGGDERESDAVHLRRQDLEPRVSERPPSAGGPCRHPGGDDREEQRGGVGDHVAGVGQERERVRDDAGRDLRDHDDDHDAKRSEKRAAVGVEARVMMAVVSRAHLRSMSQRIEQRRRRSNHSGKRLLLAPQCGQRGRSQRPWCTYTLLQPTQRNAWLPATWR